MADEEHSSALLLKLIICLVAAASAAVVVTIYHCLTARYTLRGRHIPQPEQPTSLDNSMAELLPAHRFRKGLDNGTCAICLCEFEEGEELRTLPECVHSFHAPCIDMWLYSHGNCPICRTGVGNYAHFDSPMLVQLLDSNSHQSAVILQVHNVL